MHTLRLFLIALATFGVTTDWVHADPASQSPVQAERYGTVHFPVSCTPAAQEQFDWAVTMLHSFFYPEMIKAFTTVAETDPQCAMAYWGIAHYLIHSYDYRPLAERGLPAAQKYAQIAPSAPHALHMPSHIYSMLGQWQASIASNTASLAAAKAYAATHYAPGVSDPPELHLYDFMAYADLQLGRNQDAKHLLEAVQAITQTARTSIVVETGFAAVPARYVLERGAWREAAALTPRVSPYPYAEAIGYFTRTMGATHTAHWPKRTRTSQSSRSSMKRT